MNTAVSETLSTADAHLRAFATLAPDLPGSGVEWLAALRRDAFKRFEDAGLPNRRLEAWKFTALDLVQNGAFTPAAAGRAPEAPALPGPEDWAARLVFVDGRLIDGLSDIPALGDGIILTTLARALEHDPGLIQGHISTATDAAGALWDLNAAFMADGAVLHLADGVRLETPISLVFLATGATGGASHTRNIFTLARGAEAQVIETYASAGPSAAPAFANAVTDIALAEGAALTHARVQDQGPAAVHTARAVVDVGAEARYASFALALGARLSRQETDLAFSAPGGRARLMGAYLGRGRQHLDHTTRVDHAYPNCETEELFKGVLDDHAHGVFQGLIRVAPKAIGTDARQKNQALLLSERAVADTKPELEILADDVKCAHGASVGDIDADALFYLMARGLPEAEARRLLIGGFVGEVIDRFDAGALGEHLHHCVARWQDEDAGGDDD
ncbi:MAG: Fe-S cluster assembly protein SufD [Alphaproteobacteria bacterium]|nr:Fe-S cluster assembly protein SufD [Alphaproteobacteria bacterium]